APVFPNVIGTLPPGVLVNFSTMNPRIENAYSEQGSFEIERQIGRNSTISVAYQHLRGLHLMMSVNQNVPTCVASGTNNGCRPNPNYANNSQYSSVGESNYHGLHVSFMQRPSRWGDYRISYTLSKSFNNVGEAFFSSPIDPFDLSKDWGRSDDDQRHRLTAFASLNSPAGPATDWVSALTRDFTLSAMMQSYSALPFNITTGTNTVQGTAARPTVDGAFIVRNAGEGRAFA